MKRRLARFSIFLLCLFVDLDPLTALNAAVNQDPEKVEAYAQNAASNEEREDLDRLIHDVLTVAQGSEGAVKKLDEFVQTVFKSAERLEGLKKFSDFEALHAFIQNVMSEWQVPGLALAVTYNDEVIYARGYGFRDLENHLPVTTKTLFAIGSITKSFTVTGLGMLVDEGKLDWDKPVREYLPDFRLYDAVATEQMTPLDLVVHRSGLPRHDMLWYSASLSREEIYKRLRYLEPSEPFRSAWQYQNLMLVTAGYLAEKITGTSWESFTHERIFKPLGMKTANFSVNDSQTSKDFAKPYTEVEKEVKLIPFRNLDAAGPAGSINANVDEMIRYVQFHLNKGKLNDVQLLSQANAEMMQTPQMVIPGAIQYDEVGHNSYGMGFMIGAYQGHKLVQHGGGIDGFISLLTFLPRKNIGVIILTNKSGNNPIPSIVTYNILDQLLGLKTVDWAKRIREQQAQGKEAQAEAEKKGYTGKREGTSPSHKLAEYAGTYEHPAYGVVSIEFKDDELQFKMNNITSPLKHFHYDIFEIPKDPLNVFEETKVTFLYDVKGDINRLSIPLEPSVHEIIFERKADEAMTQHSFLEKFVGEYTISAVSIQVALKGENTLTLYVPGQPVYSLVPTQGQKFSLKGLEGYSVEFKNDESGRISEVVFYQPNGTFVAKRKP